MICMSLSTLKIRGSDGVVRELEKGQIFIPKYPEVVKPLLEAGRVRIIDSQKPISEERKRTLDDCMTATIISIRDEIVKGNMKWQHSPATREVEAEIERIQHDIMEGKCKLIDFQLACEKWKKAGAK
jgi:hypothetical protein